MMSEGKINSLLRFVLPLLVLFELYGDFPFEFFNGIRTLGVKGKEA